MSEKAVGHKYRRTLVCVDSYEDGVMRGRLRNPFLDGEEIPFRGVMEFLKRMGRLLSDMQFPQNAVQLRRFAPQADESAPTAMSVSAQGTLCTFELRVLYRQHASWQGAVVWCDEGSEQSFRSVLELLMLMDSAIERARKRLTP